MFGSRAHATDRTPGAATIGCIATADAGMSQFVNRSTQRRSACSWYWNAIENGKQGTAAPSSFDASGFYAAVRIVTGSRTGLTTMRRPVGWAEPEGSMQKV